MIRVNKCKSYSFLPEIYQRFIVNSKIIYCKIQWVTTWNFSAECFKFHRLLFMFIYKNFLQLNKCDYTNF